MQTKKRPAGRGGPAGLAALAGVLLAGIVTGAGAPAGASPGSGGTPLAHAKHQLIVHGDFPKGWTVSGSVTTSAGGQGNFPGADLLASCLGVPSSVINVNAPAVSSPDFGSADGRDNAQENLSVFSSVKVAAQGYRALASAKTPGCMTSLLQGSDKAQLQDAIGHGITIGTVTVTGIPRSALGPHASGFTISFPAIVKGGSLATTVAIIDVLRGRLGAQLMLSGVGKGFPAGLEKHLVAVAYSRL